MELVLRDYQQKLIDDARLAISQGKRAPILRAPTGAGKTPTAAAIIRSAVGKGNTVGFMVHRRELITQASNTFAKFGIDHSFIANGLDFDPAALVHLCSVGTYINRLDKLPLFDVLILDECHHGVAPSWLKIIQAHKDAGKVVIGFTATPERLDGRGMAPTFDEIVHGPETIDLINRGYLADFRFYAAQIKPDLSKVGKVAGDYNLKALNRAVDTPQLVSNIVENWEKRAKGKKTLVFATGISHSKNIVAQFKLAGYRAAHLDGGTPTQDRIDTLQAFGRGEYEIVSNCMLFGEGFDVSALTGIDDLVIECVVFARPTASLCIYLQQAGRALRIQDDPAILLDHAGHLANHGLPDQVRDWSLAGRKTREIVKTQECPECGGIFYKLPRKTRCPYCDALLPVPVPREMKPKDWIEMILEEIDRGLRPWQRKAELLAKAETYEQVREIAKQFDYKWQWAAHECRRRNIPVPAGR